MGMCCERLIVLSGPSYFKRLWCCYELFVYSVTNPRMDNVIFWSLEHTSIQDIKLTTEKFKMSEVRCFLESDKIAIMLAIESYKGGIPKFEHAIRELGMHVYSKHVIINSSMVYNFPFDSRRSITRDSPSTPNIARKNSRTPRSVLAAICSSSQKCPDA